MKFLFEEVSKKFQEVVIFVLELTKFDETKISKSWSE